MREMKRRGVIMLPAEVFHSIACGACADAYRHHSLVRLELCGTVYILSFWSNHAAMFSARHKYLERYCEKGKKVFCYHQLFFLVKAFSQTCPIAIVNSLSKLLLISP